MAFKMLDSDNSGNIDFNEILSVLGCGDRLKEKAIIEAIEEIDGNGDGEISYIEFMIMMASGTD
jgi:calcium-dependent protein kinase